MLERREEVASKEDSETEGLAEESDEFDDESPFHRGVELDMNRTDTDQTMVRRFKVSRFLTGMV